MLCEQVCLVKLRCFDLYRCFWLECKTVSHFFSTSGDDRLKQNRNVDFKTDMKFSECFNLQFAVHFGRKCLRIG